MTQPKGGKPTVRQIYALAAVLCALCDEPFPDSQEQASELIERFRRETGHPRPRLEDTRRRRSRRRARRAANDLTWPAGAAAPRYSTLSK